MKKHDSDFRAAIANLKVALAGFEECLRKLIETDKAAERGPQVVSSTSAPHVATDNKPAATTRRRRKNG